MDSQKQKPDTKGEYKMTSETMLQLLEDVLAKQLTERENTRKWALEILSELTKGYSPESD
jgi:hypothetical protein